MGTCRYSWLVFRRARGRPETQHRWLLALFCAVFTLLLAGAANAEPLPPYEGAMSFRDIEGPAGPQDFSWQVSLSEDQALEQVDDQTARVYWVPGHEPAFTINATLAHDVPCCVRAAESRNRLGMGHGPAQGRSSRTMVCPGLLRQSGKAWNQDP